MHSDTFKIFRGTGSRTEEWLPLPDAVEDERRDAPEHYIASDGLREAVNIALHLARPLLVTGEPGTGKTQLAYRLAYELTPKTPKPLRFQTKTRAEASDLFYRYDAMRHFQEVQVSKNEKATARDFIRMEALGIAILRSCENRAAANRYLDPEHQTATPVRSVVLIDEIDKAPRDLPNDLLAEIENMSFEIKETRETFQSAGQYKPVVVITSNSERDLPEAFLRRCVYYHIPLPELEALREIVSRRANPSSAFTATMLDNALAKFTEIRERVSKKKPATDELIAWVKVLDALHLDPKSTKDGDREALGFSYSVLLKDAGDLEAISKQP